MRTPNLAKVPEIVRHNGDWVEQVRTYSVITPLYGGGVEPAQADPISVVRGTEIRGQLRFWWRAARGGVADGDISRLWEEEGRIWGTAAGVGKPGPSQVEIAVRMDNAGHLVAPFRIEGGRLREDPATGVPAYAAFPLQPTQEEIRARIPLKQVRTDVTFTLILRYPEGCASEVATALWAWETFGGIGARTRRGFGALQCVSVDGKAQPLPIPTHIEDLLIAGLDQHVHHGKWPDNVPHLAKKMSFKSVQRGNSNEAWTYLIDKLRQFRQERAGGRFGNSQWSEPDAIRRRSGGTPKGVTSATHVDKFPRAALGMPIIFHFKNEGPQTPPDTSLQPVGAERLSSPLILRPIACKDGAVALALILEAPLPTSLELKGVRSSASPSADLTVAEAENIVPLKGNPDVLRAFLKTL